MKKRLLSTLLTLCMILSLLPMQVLATELAFDSIGSMPLAEENGEFDKQEESKKDESPEVPEGPGLLESVVSGTCGENLTWEIDSGGTLTISGTGAMEDFVYPSPWSNYSFHAAVINRGVTSIGAGAFSDCSGLTSVIIPDTVTSIGALAFDRCSGLASLTIPNGVTSIGQFAFHGCSGLASVTIPNGVTSIASVFQDCSGLTSVTIPNSVTDISCAFYGCSGLTSINIPRSVISIGGQAFHGCSGLTSLTIPNGVTNIELGAFNGCSGLTSVTIPGSVTSIGNAAFFGCSSLTNLTISNGVTSIGDIAFDGCSSLTDVIIPSSVTSIGRGVFYGSGLNRVCFFNSATSIESDAICNGIHNHKAVTIYGYKNSTANQYASEHGFSFVPLGAGEAAWNPSPSIPSPGQNQPQPPKNLTVTIFEKKRGTGGQKDSYQFSAGASVLSNGVTSQTGKDGTYRINDFTNFTQLTVSKPGYTAVTRTREQLGGNPAVYLEPDTDGKPTVKAVWLDGVDILHSEYSIDLLEENPVTITADVEWDSTMGEGSIKLVQGSKSVTFAGNSVTTVLKDNFDVSKTIYIWAGYDKEYSVQEELKLTFVNINYTFNWDSSMSFGKIPLLQDDESELNWEVGLDFDLYSPIPVTIEVENGKVYAAIGLQKGKKYDEEKGWTAKSFAESVRELKEVDSAIDRYKRVSAMKTFGAKAKGYLGIDANFSVMGFAEGYIDKNGKARWLNSGLLIMASGNADTTVPFSIVGVPLFFEAELSAEATAQLNLAIQEAAKTFTPNGVIEAEISLSGGVGVGIKKVASLSGGLEGELSDHWEIILGNTDYNRLTAKLKAYAKMEVLLFNGKKKWELAGKTWERPNPSSLRSFDAEPYTLYADLYDASQYTLKSEAEMTDSSVFTANNAVSLFSAGSGGTKEAPFVDDVYSQARPQLAAFSDGTLLAVWVGLDNSRPTYDRPRLYYALCTDGRWSASVPVNAAGMYMEADPALVIVNDMAYLAWSGANEGMGTPATLEEMASKLDIFAASFDRTNRQWSVSALTQDQAADYSPVIGAGPGGVAVAWQSNSANDLFGTSGANSVSACQYVDMEGVWTPSTRYDNVGEVIDLSIDMSGGVPRIAWTQAETEGASAVYLDGVRYASGSGVVFDNGSLYWYQDRCLYQDGQDTGVVLNTDCFQIEDGTLLYLSSNGLCSALMAHYYDSGSGCWSGAVALSDGSTSLGSFSAAYAGDSLKVLISSTEVLKALEDIQSDADDPYGSTNLVLLESTSFCDLSIGKPWYLEEAYASGSTVTFYLDVTNNGTVPINYLVSVSGADGTAYSTISQQRLLPGCTEEAVVAYTQGDVLASQLTFTVTALEDIKDTNPSDNQSMLTLQYEDVAVEHIGNGVTEDGQYLVYADIVNRGYGVQSGITVGIYRDEISDSPLQTLAVGPLTSMSSQPVSFRVEAPADQTCYIIAVTSNGMDMNAATDSDFTVCVLQEATEDTLIELISVDGNQVELSLENVPAGTLVVAAYDGNGKMDSVGMADIQVGTATVRIAMQNKVPASNSLVAFVLDTATKEPLMKRVDLT